MKNALTLVVFALAAALLLSAGAARAQDPEKPVLLVAVPAMQGLYRETTVVAVPVAGTHIGFILNRASEFKLGALFPGHGPSAKVVDPVYFGGPEMNEAIFAVVRGDPGAKALHLFGELFVVSSATAVDRVIEQTPNDARYFAGFVGWRPGELAKELEAGYWYTAEPDAGLFFRPDTSGLWKELLERVGGSEAPRAQGMRAASLRLHTPN
jgi:putative transcriptional regulator